MRFHCLGVQHTVTDSEYVACAFTQKVLKFCEMMTTRGHTVIHYGHEDSDLLCTEHVTVVTRLEFDTIYGVHDHRTKLFNFNIGDDVYQTFNRRAIEEIGKRKQAGDFLLAFWGVGHKQICDAHPDMCVVEPGIGYAQTFARYRVFESYAIYHAMLGMNHVSSCFVHDDEFENDAIVPNYYDPKDFEPVAEKDDYFLFVGRIGVAKGLGRAIQMTKALGARLIVAGQNAEAGFREEGFWPIPDHVELVGYIGVDERKKLMARAKAVVCFSRFVEPFCGVHVESMLSGTPVITCDWGAMTEFNIHGTTGFRCRTLDEMIEAGKNIHTIDPKVCRAWAMSRFSTPVIAKEYERYFERVYKKETTLDHVRIQREEQPFADRLGPCLKRLVGPKKFLDIGCGPGMHVRVMDSLGVQSTGNISCTADLVMSLETAAKSEERYADDIVESVARAVEPGGTLVWTSASPSQKSIHNINCQPKEYWIEKFERRGLVRDESLECAIKTEMLQGYHMGWFIQNLVVFKKRKPVAIAVWCEMHWAHGRIATSLQKYIPDADVVLYDWRDWANTERLFFFGEWEQFDYIMCPSDVFEVSPVSDELKRKLIITTHCPATDNGYFKEYFKPWTEPRFCGVSHEVCTLVKGRGVTTDVTWTPYGADLDIFHQTHAVDYLIRKIGITGGWHDRAVDAYVVTKGLREFVEICKQIGAEPVYLIDREGADIYKDIDLLICCSQFEAGPLGIFEAAACGVPVLTRPVGNAQLVKGIAMFDTVDDAVAQIRAWNSSIDTLRAHAAAVTAEVRTNWSMEKLITRHIVPLVRE
jgi:glycosyltransferase involved in cell wall biosynthesis